MWKLCDQRHIDSICCRLVFAAGGDKRYDRRINIELMDMCRIHCTHATTDNASDWNLQGKSHYCLTATGS